MLKKPKKLNLQKEEDKEVGERQKHDNRLHGKHKWKHLKYIFAPALIAVILLLLNLPTTTVDGIILKTTTELRDYEESQNKTIDKESFLIINPDTQLAGVIGCTEYLENCTLYCVDGSVSFIDENLEKLQSKCKNIDLNLIVAKCEFSLGLLQQSFFFGEFSLGYFSINECNLKTIKAATFKHNNAKNIQTLILRNNQLTTLDDSYFEGLTNLINFEFVQTPLPAAFQSKVFFKHLANKLINAVVQPSTNGSDVFDPLVWWQDLIMFSLISLDMSNTNLQGSLNSKTFQRFEVVEYVSLYNCNLLSITAATFDVIGDTLEYLDLRYNHLQTLDSEFLLKFGLSSIVINLCLNDWYCECDTEMLQYFIEYNSVLAEDMICNSPEKWHEMELLQVVNECGESETTTSKNIPTYSMIPPTTTTNATTTSATTTSASTTSATTVSTTKIITTDETTETDYTITTEDSRTFSTNPNSSTTTTIGHPTTTVTTTTTTHMSTSVVPYTSTLKTPSFLLSLKCNSSQEEGKIISKYVIQPNTKFSIITTSIGSVKINVQITAEFQSFFVLYFSTRSDNKTIAESLDSETESNIFSASITNLKPANSYVFCLTTESDLNVSPFDCLAHFVKGPDKKTSWLLTPDKVWFITSTTIIALLLFFAAIALIYILLRQNPRWLINRNERILPINNSNRKVLLVSKNSRIGYKSPNPSPISQRSSNYLKSLAPIKEDENYDIESSVYSSHHTAPVVKAPILPPTHRPPTARISRKLYNSSCTTATRCKNSPKTSSQNMDYLDVIEDDPDYQTIDYYETIK